MGVRVHPAESLAAFDPWLALEWHPTRNALRPDQVTRASAREVVGRQRARRARDTAAMAEVVAFHPPAIDDEAV
jgi:hypothetical protein